MDDDDQLESRELDDAAVVHAARRQIGEAVAALAIRPLDEPAAAMMRAALGSQGSARAAIARLEAAERARPDRRDESPAAGAPAGAS